MSRVHRIQLTCEIDSRSESIHGEMRDVRGKTLAFRGWTEFAGALVSLTEDESREPAPEGCEYKQPIDGSNENQ